MATESTKEYIRQQVRDNLIGHAYDRLNLKSEEDVNSFIETQKDNIEKVVKNCLDDDTFQRMKDEGYEDINEYILSEPDDFFRDCMCGVGIPEWDTL